MAVYCAVAPNFNNFMAARILDGFFSTVTQAGGLVFIQDMFFFHEQVSSSIAMPASIHIIGCLSVDHVVILGSNDKLLDWIHCPQPLSWTCVMSLTFFLVVAAV